MFHSRLNILFLFDFNYLAPALVSVASLLEALGNQIIPVSLIYLEGPQQDNDKARAVLRNFQAKLTTEYPNSKLDILELSGDLFSTYVKRHHFSKTILYKAILPKAFSQLENILLFDCGMIFGQGLHNFLVWLDNSIITNKISTIAAFCVPSGQRDGLDQDLQAVKHNSKYPTGGTLYFDVKKYIESSVYERLLSTFQSYREKLIYAEQDLMCLTLREAELSAFPEIGVRCHIDLASPQSWENAKDYDDLYLNREFFYLKHVGSFKPWKKWVLHPAKSIFIKERKKTYQFIDQEYWDLLIDNEFFPENIGFLGQQLAMLEDFYERKL
jgi:lipopolysaccharide biosynthesis glycosyltransferase